MNAKIYSILAAGILLTASCSEAFLERDPSNGVDVTTALQTTADLADAVNGLYATVKSSSFLGRDVLVLNDLLADNDFISTNNYGRFLAENAYTFSQSSGSSSGIWSQGYYVILQANRIIYADLPADDASNHLKGEAYAIRGLSYLVLVNFFGAPHTVLPSAPGVPVVTLPVFVTGTSSVPARNTVAEVYDQITGDLNEAFRLIPEKGIDAAYHSTGSNYLAKYAVKALLSRAYLYKGDYAAARDAALEVIEKGGYSLTKSESDYLAYWASNTPSTNKVETIWELNMSVTSNNGGNGIDHMYNQAGYGDLLANKDVYELYSDTDSRRKLVIDGTRRGGSQKAYICNKYTNTASGDRDEVKIIRLAEVYLTLAEALARTNDEAKALDYLNRIAQLRDPEFAGFNSSGRQLIDDIVNERRKELVFEGFRLFDLLRLNREIVRPVQPYSTTTYPYVSLTDHRRIQAIPQTELDVNPNIEQNPGY
ncbi:MAG: RagB/SusD family nutrient uptake outer membrane protein [Tannerella sp.]|jgi:tetratricopeptide (TPR) repeat protein|nr:RagB/SusD family nutrient uptake outer membrane protein [Tannerella sp.]